MKFVCAISVVALIGCQKENPEFCCTSAETCSDLGVSGTRDCAGGFTCIDDIHTCVADGCGNGVIDDGEVCDDGNNVNDDGCSGNCLEASCFVPVTHPNIQAAVDDASCAEIHAVPGVYVENLVIDRDAAIVSVGPDPVVLDGQAVGSVVAINSGTVTLENIVVRNGQAAQGGGIFNRGTATLRNVRVESNTANAAVGAGGGIYNDGGSLVLDQTSVTGNHATTAGGGIFSTNGSIKITGGTLAGNDIRSIGVVGIAAKGAGIALDAGDLDLTGTTVTANVIDIDVNPGMGVIETARGAGVFVETGTVRVSASTLSDNTLTMKGDRPEATGAGIFAPQLQLTDTTIQNNSIHVIGNADAGAVGAGLYIAGSAPSTISNARVMNNVINLMDADAGGPASRGGGIAIDGDANVTIDKSQITNNQVVALGDELLGEGGGISWRPISSSNNTVLSVSGSVIADNLVRVMECFGGGIGMRISSATPRMVIRQSTVSGNQIVGEVCGGAGVFANPINTSGLFELAIDDSTVSGNTIQATTGIFEGAARGAGVGVHGLKAGASRLDIASTTIAANSASGDTDVTGGIALENADAQVRNSIIAKNSAPLVTACWSRRRAGATVTTSSAPWHARTSTPPATSLAIRRSARSPIMGGPPPPMLRLQGVSQSTPAIPSAASTRSAYFSPRISVGRCA